MEFHLIELGVRGKILFCGSIMGCTRLERWKEVVQALASRDGERAIDDSLARRKTKM